MKKLLLVVTVILSLPSTAQDCWKNTTYTQHTEINTNYVYQPYQQNPYAQPVYTQPVYANPYQYTQQDYYQNNYYQNDVHNASHTLGHAIGELINIVIRETGKTRNNQRCRNHRVRNCNFCR